MANGKAYNFMFENLYRFSVLQMTGMRPDQRLKAAFGGDPGSLYADVIG